MTVEPFSVQHVCDGLPGNSFQGGEGSSDAPGLLVFFAYLFTASFALGPLFGVECGSQVCGFPGTHVLTHDAPVHPP